MGLTRPLIPPPAIPSDGSPFARAALEVGFGMTPQPSIGALNHEGRAGTVVAHDRMGIYTTTYTWELCDTVLGTD
jgi:hypothetical protein